MFEDMVQIPVLKKAGTYLLSLYLLSHATAAFCDDTFYVIWKNIGLPDAVRLVSQYSGRVIRLAPEVLGTITVASTDPLTSDEVFALFERSLHEHGLALVPVHDNEYQVKAAEQDAGNSTGQSATSALNALPPQSAKRQYVGAIFAFEWRAQEIVARLRAAGGEAEVLAPGNPTDKDFSVVLLYRDNADDYQAMISAVERAGLSSLISTPALPVELPAHKK